MDAPESLGTPAARARVSHPVIATYVADAVAQVAGAALAGARSGRVTGAEGPVDIELHVALRAGIAAPAACHAPEDAVRTYRHSMVALQTARLSVVVEEVAGVAD